jgi:hypothetical protein
LAVAGFSTMRILEENRNIVLLAIVMLFTATIAGAAAWVAPASDGPAESKPAAHLTDQTPVRVVGAPFAPNVNPSEHR